MNTIWPLTLYYDGACQLCRAEMRNIEMRDTGGLLRFVDISQPGFDKYPPGTDRDALMRLLHAQQADGTVLAGVEVFRLAYSAAGLPWVARLTRLPGLKALSEAIYPLIARNRYRLPSGPIRWLFEVSLRRAAERSARRLHCDGGQCRVVPVSTDRICSEQEKSS
jgi:predicted DCC family thiol-disulfide oxidoreductase YuxK